MKKAIFLISLLWCLAMNGQTPEGLGEMQRVIGHTVTDDIDVSGAAFMEPGTYSLGALLSPAMLENYKGCKVVGVRMAAARDLGRSRVFLYEETPSGLTELHAQNQRLYEGWNNIFFNGNGIDISADNGLFFGFDYTETPEMVADEEGGICGVGNTATGGFMLIIGGHLYDVTGVGNLCVQLIVDVTNLPARNLAFTMVDGGFKYKPAGESLEVFAMVQNTGRERVDSYRIGARFGEDGSPMYFDEEQTLLPGASDTWQHLFPIDNHSTLERRDLTLWFESVNGEVLPEELRKPITLSRNWYGDSMTRTKAYLEVYTDQENVAGSLFDEVLEGLSDDDRNKVVITRVPAPGNPLEAPGCETLHGLYAYTLPSFTMNRAYFPGEAHTAFDINDYFGILPPEFLSTIISDIIYQDYLSPTFANVRLESDYDAATRKVSVRAFGETLDGIRNIVPDIGVTLMLTESEVSGKQAYLNNAGIPKYYNSYAFDDLLRGYMTDPEGDEVELVSPGNQSAKATFELRRELTLPEGWDPMQMSVTALVHDVKDPTTRQTGDCDILDCIRVPLMGGSGVRTFGGHREEGSVKYYDLQGRELQEKPSHGIYLTRGELRM